MLRLKAEVRPRRGRGRSMSKAQSPKSGDRLKAGHRAGCTKVSIVSLISLPQRDEVRSGVEGAIEDEDEASWTSGYARVAYL